MGQTLGEPITAKESAYCQSDDYRVGSSCMQGWRINMEDSHTHILALPEDPEAAFFAVYDGHGGSSVAKYAGMNLHKLILKQPEYPDDIPLAMQKGFLALDEAMLNEDSLRDIMAGSTAVSALIRDNKLYCANAGDSRAIAFVGGQVEVLSMDHKPNNDIELKRISEGGGFVEFNRVNGNLALSRAVGDFVFKRNVEKSAQAQIVTAWPDVEVRELSPDWDFLVLACDGIWDVLSNEDVCDFVRKEIAQGLYPEEICENLMTKCLAPDCQMSGLGGDNMTVILVCFLHNKPYEELIEKCKKSLSDVKTKIIDTTNTTRTDSDEAVNNDDENDDDDEEETDLK